MRCPDWCTRSVSRLSCQRGAIEEDEVGGGRQAAGLVKEVVEEGAGLAVVAPDGGGVVVGDVEAAVGAEGQAAGG